MSPHALLPLALALPAGLPAASPRADDWPQWRGPRRYGTWRETGLVDSFDGDELPLVWSTPIGPGYSGPIVAEGRVFVTDRDAEPEERERIVAFSAETGEHLWTHSYPATYEGIGYDAGPRCSVLVADGRVYSLGAVGHLFCLDAAKGEVVWAHDLRAELEVAMPTWGFGAAPVLEGGLLVVPANGKDACLVAYDAATGEERWRALSDRGNYSAPIVIDQAGERIVVCWTGDRVVGVEARTGALRWAVDHPSKRMPLGVASPVLAGDRLFLAGFYDGSLCLRVHRDEAKVDVAWRRCGQSEVHTDALQGIISTPLVLGEHVYGVDSYGELRCLRLADGERVWEDLTAVPKARWATIHFVQNGETTWMFNERGELLIGRLTPPGFHEVDRARLLPPTLAQLGQRGGVCWAHPAFAGRRVFARNDEVLVCADLAAKGVR